MASKIASYKFDNSDNKNAAYDKISSAIGTTGISYYSDEIIIYSDCRDAALAGQICSANGGKAQ